MGCYGLSSAEAEAGRVADCGRSSLVASSLIGSSGAAGGTVRLAVPSYYKPARAAAGDNILALCENQFGAGCPAVRSTCCTAGRRGRALRPLRPPQSVLVPRGNCVCVVELGLPLVLLSAADLVASAVKTRLSR